MVDIQGPNGNGRNRTLRWAGAAAAAVALALASGAGLQPAAAATGVTAGGATNRVTSRSTQPATIADAPTLIAHTALGDVGYREEGEGSTILLIAGYNSSMDSWTPSFIDTLAAHHHVVVFDNAGVGKTAMPPGPLTISSMADQTSALISTLRLGRPAVLGWSMGGMIAQALAVRHPGQVDRLVLAATQSGDGRALPIPASALALLDSPDPLVVLSALFPADQSAAVQAYIDGIISYTGGFYGAPAATAAAQYTAILQWMAGQDPTGLETDRIHVPTLIADGVDDLLDPTANSYILASAIPGAQVLLFPDAGHAFLIQDYTEFDPIVDLFVC